MSTIKYSFAAGAAVIAMLAACGDDVTNVTEVNEKAAIDLVEKYKELPKCEDSLYGTLIYAADSSQVYACTSDGWASLKGEKGDQGDGGLNGEDGKNGTNGTNGKNGEDGADGADGESCTATPLSDGSGMEVMCGGKTVGVISNGTNGKNGEDGMNCDIVSDVDGVVTIQCGEGENAQTTKLYKAMCGTDPFDPEKQFCAKFNDDAKTEQVYKMVTIAPEGTNYSETWMAENLNYETENSWCGGGSGTTEGDCAKYGRLYTWAAAMEACPTGWHLPSKEEWEKLIVAVDDNITEYFGENVAGKFLKSKTGWKEFSIINNEDAFGFSALPAGLRFNDGYYFDDGYGAYLWSSTEDGSDYAYYLGLNYDRDYAILNNYDKNTAFSVRCLKD